MFCTKCGTPMPEDARFCPKCGFPVPETLIQVHKNEQEQMSSDEAIQELSTVDAAETTQVDPVIVNEIHEVDEHAEIKEFIGNNADYYLRKWGKSSKPEKAVGWNWAAFFLTGYWLGYRKMYIQLLIWFLFIVAINVVFLMVGFDHLQLTLISDLVVICINVGFGMYGNALYYRHAQKKIKQWNDDPSLQSKTTLAKMGGTGWLAVILLIVANVVLAIIISVFMVVSIFSSSSALIHNNSGVSFGTGSDDSGVTGIQDHFSSDSPIYLEATFDSPVGTDRLKIVLIKEKNSNEEIVDKWNQDVDPSWESIYFNLYDPTQDGYLDPGHYIVRIYDGSDLLDEGEFDITSLSIDGGSNEIQF